MEIQFAIKLVLTLIIILGILIFFLFFSPFKEREKEKKQHKLEKSEDEIPTFQTLVKIIRNKKTSSKELSNALELVIKYYGKVHPKLGIRSHPDMDEYINILFTICIHPNTTKDMILKFDKELTKINPEYKPEINEAIAKGLASRQS